MLHKLPTLTTILITALLASCAHVRTSTQNKSDQTSSADSNVADDGATEESDTSDTEELAESTEQTPEDLGDVEASDTLQADEIQADRLARQTFPLVTNEFVEQWTRYFSGRGKGFFEKWLARSTRYIPLMKEVLRKDGLPEDLIYLSMIESGFNTKAKSRAKAVGPWQFMKATGERYGLEVTYWVDERRDFIKSSHAAAQYLKELQQIFGSWYLAAAAYNAGEGKVLFAVRRDRSRNFWELIRTKKNFRAETRNYVPKIIGAALVAKNPARYGFDNIEFQEPLTWQTVKVPGGVQLRQVAQIVGTTTDEMELLNPELRRNMTPPGRAEYEMRVPVGKKEILIARMSELKSHNRGNFLIHTVRRGENLGAIARNYGSEVQEIMELNNIQKVTRLRIGQELSIPVPEGGSTASRKRSKRSVVPAAAAQTPAVLAPGTYYIVKSGDTLWDLAKRHNVSVEAIKRANNLRSVKGLREGQRLSIPDSNESKKDSSFNRRRGRNPIFAR